MQRYLSFTPSAVHRCTHAAGFLVSTSRVRATDVNTGIIQVSRNDTLPIPLHDSTHKVSTSHLKSSQADELSSSSLHFTSLITGTLNWELWTRSLNWKRSDLPQLPTFGGCLPPITTCKRSSISPINLRSDTQETLLPTVLLLLQHCWNAWCHCWHGHVTSPYSCVIQVFIAVAC
jgi:hypothetical protein